MKLRRVVLTFRPVFTPTVSIYKSLFRVLINQQDMHASAQNFEVSVAKPDTVASCREVWRQATVKAGQGQGFSSVKSSGIHRDLFLSPSDVGQKPRAA